MVASEERPVESFHTPAASEHGDALDEASARVQELIFADARSEQSEPNSPGQAASSSRGN